MRHPVHAVPPSRCAALRRRATLLRTVVVVVVLACGSFVAPAEAVKRRAFVTSVQGTGDIASWPGATGATVLDKADSICRARAAVAGLPNASAYRAWLSISGNDAYCHVQGLGGTKANGCNNSALPGGGPWYLVNGITNFTGTLDQLVGPARLIYRPVTWDELGNVVNDDENKVWTGTDRTGVATSSCADWTIGQAGTLGRIGYALGTGTIWTDHLAHHCSEVNRLLCLEPGTSETTSLRWSPGAIVFVTSAAGTGELGSWPDAQGATGVNAGFAICRKHAERAGLPSPGSFVPWISTPLVDARDRLTTDGPFRRIDGYTIANNFDDLVDLSSDNSLHVFEDGSYLSEHAGFVHTGTDGEGNVFTDGHCDFWTDAAETSVSRQGNASMGLTRRWTSTQSNQCASVAHLYCFSNRITVSWDGFETGGFAHWSNKSP